MTYEEERAAEKAAERAEHKAKVLRVVKWSALGTFLFAGFLTVFLEKVNEEA